MATYSVRVPSSLPPAEAFAYMARFSNAAEWDPGVVGAEELTPGPPEIGRSTYRLKVGFAGRQVPLDYHVADIDEPTRVVFVAENGQVRSVDTISVSPSEGGGSVVSYDATLSLKGVAVLLTPFLGRSFRRIGDRAAAGLRTKLNP